MGLNYPAGPIIDKKSKEGNANKFKFTIPNVDGFVVAVSGSPNAITFIISIPSKAKPLIKSKFVILDLFNLFTLF